MMQLNEKATPNWEAAIEEAAFKAVPERVTFFLPRPYSYHLLTGSSNPSAGGIENLMGSPLAARALASQIDFIEPVGFSGLTSNWSGLCIFTCYVKIISAHLGNDLWTSLWIFHSEVELP